MQRRSMLSFGLLLVLLSAGAAGWWTRPHPSTPANAVVLENQQAGTATWQIGRVGFRVADDRGGQIKGYASATSAAKRERIAFYVSVTPAQSYMIDLYRLGWYAGKGGRLLQHLTARPGLHQPTCPGDEMTGLIACNWTASYNLTIPDSWTSGVYLAVLTNAQHYQNTIIFVVRDDQRQAALLYQQSVMTYQAYNSYPDDQRTGKSLYEDSSRGATTVAQTSRAVKVSFDRPYSRDGAGQFFAYEAFFVHWLERSGYDVTYSTDIDTHRNGTQLLNYKGFLSVGHDEYWSQPMRDAVETARDAGIHLAFFGANSAFWQVRFEPSAHGIPNRIMVCYKNVQLDPEPNGTLKTIQWRNLGRPEQSLVGVQYTLWSTPLSNTSLLIANSASWVYHGTGLHDGDRVPGIVGYEIDGAMPDYPLPQSTTYTILGRSPFIDHAGKPDLANAAIYRAPSGAWVFAAGTIGWSFALDRPGLVDHRIQRTTANILDAFVHGG